MARQKKVENPYDIIDLDPGKYILGDKVELDYPKANLTKKQNYKYDKKDDIYIFKTGEKSWDLIEYNSKLLLPNQLLLLIKDEQLKKTGKLKGCRRFESKEPFKIKVCYTDEDYCLYFYRDDEPSPFMIYQDENLI